MYYSNLICRLFEITRNSVINKKSEGKKIDILIDSHAKGMHALLKKL